MIIYNVPYIKLFMAPESLKHRDLNDLDVTALVSNRDNLFFPLSCKAGFYKITYPFLELPAALDT